MNPNVRAAYREFDVTNRQPSKTTPCIYVLIDPRTGDVRYVGKTTIAPHRRLSGHCTPSALRCKNHRANWIRNLLARGFKLEIHVIAWCKSDAIALRREVAIIARLRALGCNLTNGTDGGDGAVGAVRSRATRALLSAQHKGMRHDDRARANMRASWRKHPRPNPMQGRRHTKASKRKMSKKIREGFKAGRRVHNKGKRTPGSRRWLQDARRRERHT